MIKVDYPSAVKVWTDCGFEVATPQQIADVMNEKVMDENGTVYVPQTIDFVLKELNEAVIDLLFFAYCLKNKMPPTMFLHERKWIKTHSDMGEDIFHI